MNILVYWYKNDLQYPSASSIASSNASCSFLKDNVIGITGLRDITSQISGHDKPRTKHIEYDTVLLWGYVLTIRSMLVA